jgi:nucleoside phosphorylase
MTWFPLTPARRGSGAGRRRARGWRAAGAALCALSMAACGGDNGNGVSGTTPPTIAILSAFPAELAAVLEHVTVTDTVVIDGHVYRIGTLGQARVVVAMTGIGLVNSTTITTAVLDHFDVGGLVFSGVAGSTLNIADVMVPEQWTLGDGQIYAADPVWLGLARGIVGSVGAEFEHCTNAPTVTSPEVCLPNLPVMVVGGIGESSDEFNGRAFVCKPTGGDVFGCDVASSTAAATLALARDGMPPVAAAEPPPFIAQDNETAAFARVASQRGVPFIAFRAVSDGGGDPLGLPGFPAQFFAYYRLSAHNAAAAATTFVRRFISSAG